MVNIDLSCVISCYLQCTIITQFGIKNEHRICDNVKISLIHVMVNLKGQIHYVETIILTHFREALSL